LLLELLLLLLLASKPAGHAERLWYSPWSVHH